MSTEVKVPNMGESISTAIIGEIFVQDGDFVKAEAEILELETDKVNQAVYAPCSGKILLKTKTGDTVDIDATIAIIDEAAESISSKPLQTKEPVNESKSSSPSKNVSDASTLRWSEQNFINEKNETKIISEPAVISTVKEQPAERESRAPLSKIRQTIAKKMVESKQSTAMLTTFNEVDMSAVISLRTKYQELFVKKYDVKLGFLSFFVKAATAALQQFPVFNSYIEGSDLVKRNYFNIGVAVGTDKGVVVPVVRDCDTLSFAEIEKEISGYAEKARFGGLKPADLTAGGFTISNGGIYGSMLSTPILVPNQCGILGMHKIEKRAVVIGDQIEIRPIMYLALSYDHRMADGKEAVSFLVKIKQLLEDPQRFSLGI